MKPWNKESRVMPNILMKPFMEYEKNAGRMIEMREKCEVCGALIMQDKLSGKILDVI